MYKELTKYFRQVFLEKEDSSDNFNDKGKNDFSDLD